jgi:hypothetical protein
MGILPHPCYPIMQTILNTLIVSILLFSPPLMLSNKIKKILYSMNVWITAERTVSRAILIWIIHLEKSNWFNSNTLKALTIVRYKIFLILKKKNLLNQIAKTQHLQFLHWQVIKTNRLHKHKIGGKVAPEIKQLLLIFRKMESMTLFCMKPKELKIKLNYCNKKIQVFKEILNQVNVSKLIIF